jgi:hypothetical protein
MLVEQVSKIQADSTLWGVERVVKRLLDYGADLSEEDENGILVPNASLVRAALSGETSLNLKIRNELEQATWSSIRSLEPARKRPQILGTTFGMHACRIFSDSSAILFTSKCQVVLRYACHCC